MRRSSPSVLGIVTVAVLFFLYAPIGVVIANAFNADASLTSWGGFTTQWFMLAVESERVRVAAITSIAIALFSTVLSIAIAICAGLWTRTASPHARRFLDAGTYMRIVLPEVVAALSLFIFFRRLEIPLGAGAIVIGHVVFNSAYATIIIQARLRTLSEIYEEAAADLGARPRRVFLRITLPLLMPAVAVAALLTFTFSFDNVITSQFLAGGNAETLPVLLFGMARFRITPELNAIGAGVMTVTTVSFALAVVVGTAWIGRRTPASAAAEQGAR